MRILLLAVVAAFIGVPLHSAPGEAVSASPCHLTIHVPVGATLLVNGARTQQMTAVRRFVSPPLPVGKKFFYAFTATWTQNGALVTTQQQVDVSAGADLVVDMTQAERVANAQPKAAGPKSAFEKPK